MPKLEFFGYREVGVVYFEFGTIERNWKTFGKFEKI
jgi:hypothetical protein